MDWGVDRRGGEGACGSVVECRSVGLRAWLESGAGGVLTWLGVEKDRRERAKRVCEYQFL